MANYEFSKRIKTNGNVTPQAIMEFIKYRLEKTSKFEVISENEKDLVVEGKVKERVLTPVVKFKAVIEIQVEENAAKLYIDVTSGVYWVFWILFVLGFASYGVFLVIAFSLYFIQAVKPGKVLSRVLEAVETEFSIN